MAWDWGSLIEAGVQLFGANEARKDAKKAGNQAAQGAQQSIGLMRDIYNDQRNLNMPAYEAGNAARDMYMRMLGLSTGKPGYSYGTTGTGGGTAQTNPAVLSNAGGQWFADGKNGPTVLTDLYNTNDAYRKAWDEVAASHQAQFGKGYNNSSDRMSIARAMASAYNKYAQQPEPVTQPAPQQQEDPSNVYDIFRNTPGYQFGLQEGTRAIEASAAARGGLNSGATLKALQKYGTDYADQAGFNPYMNRLAGLFGGAQVAAGNMSNAGSNFGAQAGNAMQNAANARAQSTYASGNAWQQGLEGAWKSFNQFGQNQGWFD